LKRMRLLFYGISVLALAACAQQPVSDSTAGPGIANGAAVSGAARAATETTPPLGLQPANAVPPSASTSAASAATTAPVNPRARIVPQNADRLFALPVDQVSEVPGLPPLPRAIDLTTSPDDLWDRVRRGFGMPNLDSPLVLDRQIWYASKPGYLQQMVERSRRYLYHIVAELEKRGMPTELALLPMVESSFNPMAYSRAHASGLWQFIPSTGKSYKLKQNWWYDERRDVIASTTAALDYLQFLYQMHGDWHLALASYNWGENAVARAIEKNKVKGLPTNYVNLTMPAETRYYVPKLQALKNIILNPQAFSLNFNPIPNQPYFVTVTKTRDIDIQLAAKLAEMSVEELIALNPAYNRPVLAASQTQSLVLPADREKIFQANLANHSQPLVSWQTYTFRAGDKLDKLASQRGITLARLKLVNGISPRARVAPGTQLLLPIKGSRAAADPLPAVFRPPALPEPQTRRVIHVVKKGDDLASIARRYRVSAADLRGWNEIGRLSTGQKLVIMQTVQPTAKRKVTPVRKAARPVAKAAPARRSTAGVSVKR
jgi:membrane-bound lytic murein transglycosylase D